MERKEGKSTRAVIVAVVLPLLPILYFLSLGPLSWLAYHGYINPRTPFMVIYRPVDWLAEYSETFNKVLG